MKNNFKYIKNISSENNEATILLYKPIGQFKDEETGEIVDGINGEAFAQELLFLQTQVDTIHIRINSIGGSVLDGFSIISAMKNSPATICTYNDGLAASISGLILMAGDERSAMDYSITMVHNPSGGENQEVLDKIKDSLLTILENNSTLSLEELNDFMNEETYFTSLEAKEAGLIDEIISSRKKVNIENANVLEMANIFNKLISDSEMKVKKTKNKEVEVIENKLVVETITNVDGDKETPGEEETDPAEAEETEKEPEDAAVVVPCLMDKIKTHFGLNADASEEEVYDAIKSKASEGETLKADNAKLQSKVDALAAEAKQAHKTKIDAMVNSFISSGKITENERENATTLALVDFEATKNLFSKIGVVSSKSVKISDVINKAELINSAAYTLEDYWKKDPKTLEQIRNNTPDIYNELVEAYKLKQKNK